MENQNKSMVPTPEKAHASDFLWQILVPVLACVLIALVAGVLAVVASVDSSGLDTKWAQISLVFLILPFLVIGLVLLIVLFFTSRLVRKFHRFLPPQFARLNDLITSIQGLAEISTSQVTDRLITLKSTKAGVFRLLELAFRRNQAQRRKND